MKYEDLQELHDLLFSTMGLFHQKFLHRFSKESQKYPGLKKNHIKMVSLLYQHPFLTATEIAKMLNMEKGSLTTLVDQLVDFGLVNRCEDHHDRRKSLLSLTDAGKAEMEDILNDSIQRMSQILGDADPDELQEFVASLRHATEFMQKL